MYYDNMVIKDENNASSFGSLCPHFTKQVSVYDTLFSKV